MRTYIIRIVPLAALVTLAACNGAPDVDEQLRKDLEAASVGSVELAPMGGGTRVVSGVEQVKRAQPRPTAPRRHAPPVESDRSAESQDPTPAPEPRIVQQAPVSTEPVAIRPSQAPAVQPPPRGGYKTVDEVIRNAPFPIKP